MGPENRLVGKIYRSLNGRAKEWPSLVSAKFFTTVHDSMDSVKTVHSYYGLDQTADFPGDAVIKRSLSLIIFVRERLQSTSSIML